MKNKKLKIALSLSSLVLAGFVVHHATRAILRAQAESAHLIVPRVALTHSFTETVMRSKGAPIVARTTVARKFDGSNAELIDVDGNGLHTQTLMITDAQHGYMTNVDFTSRTFIRRPFSRQHAEGLKWAKGSRDAVYATKPNATFSPSPAFQGHPAFLVTYQRTADDSVISTQETALDDGNFLPVEIHEVQVNSKNGTWAKIDRVTTLPIRGAVRRPLQSPGGFQGGEFLFGILGGLSVRPCVQDSQYPGRKYSDAERDLGERQNRRPPLRPDQLHEVDGMRVAAA